MMKKKKKATGEEEGKESRWRIGGEEEGNGAAAGEKDLGFRTYGNQKGHGRLFTGQLQEGESGVIHVAQSINKIAPPPWYCLNLVLNIQKLCTEFESISFIHVFRETNRLANHLASLGGCLDENIVYFVPPLDLESDTIVKEEVANRLYTILS
ncbi:hypothetical protein IFM89_003810 [Coptis chinensis]|uniref:RNase H type-1 domain-containing protein n=1 Tax=Coptis chinensis TaxID=261450 RepID=A0A835GUE9_9MAGN|nr:hypothetical protein IFM89_003810 [Coptis chinensis]